MPSFRRPHIMLGVIVDITDSIIQELEGDSASLWALCLTSRLCYALSKPSLYCHLSFNKFGKFAQYARTVQDNPNLLAYARSWTSAFDGSLSSTEEELLGHILKIVLINGALELMSLTNVPSTRANPLVSDIKQYGGRLRTLRLESADPVGAFNYHAWNWTTSQPFLEEMPLLRRIEFLSFRMQNPQPDSLDQISRRGGLLLHIRHFAMTVTQDSLDLSFLDLMPNLNTLTFRFTDFKALHIGLPLVRNLKLAKLDTLVVKFCRLLAWDYRCHLVQQEIERNDNKAYHIRVVTQW